MQTTTFSPTVTVRLGGKWFAKDLKACKRAGGRFDGDSKTWTIPASAYLSSMTLVGRDSCPHYTRDNGCPLHGETCAPEYK